MPLFKTGATHYYGQLGLSIENYGKRAFDVIKAKKSLWLKFSYEILLGLGNQQ